MTTSTMSTRAEAKMHEINNSLTAYDFNPMSYVMAQDEAGNQYFFPYAFARSWKDPINGMEFWFIFAEHAPPVWVMKEDGAWCKQFTRVDIEEVKEND